MAFDFNEIKPTMKNICDQLDESILVPIQSPYVQLKQDDKQVELFFADKTYRFPREDVHLLPIINVTVEALAFYLHQEVQKSFKSKWGIRNFAVTIEETDGQSVTFDDDVQQKR